MQLTFGPIKAKNTNAKATTNMKKVRENRRNVFNTSMNITT